MEIGRLFIIIGVVFSLLGIAMTFGLRWPRLPGDIIIHKSGFTFAFPFTSSVLISIILTILLNLVFKK